MNRKIYLILLIGVIGYFLFYYQIDNLKITQPLEESLSKEKIEGIAKEKVDFISLNLENFRQRTELVTRNDYRNFIHKVTEIPDSAYKSVPSFAWKVFWYNPESKIRTDESGVTISTDSDISDLLENFYVILDYKGKILEFGSKFEEKTTPDTDFSLEENEKLVRKIITEFAEIDTIETPLNFIERNLSSKKTEFKYERTNKYGIKETISIRIRGSKLDMFDRDFAVQEEKSEDGFGLSNLPDIFEALFLLVIIVMTLVLFIKKAKRDELEYKRGLSIGIFVFILFFILLLNEESGWQSIILGGLIGGLFVGGGIFILYIISESINRDVWKEKLACLDILFQGYFSVKKMGLETIRGLAYGGIWAFYYFLLIFISQKYSILPITFNENLLSQLTSRFPFATTLNNNFFVVVFFSVSLFLFLMSSIRYKTEKLRYFLILAIPLTPLYNNYFGMLYNKNLIFYIFILPFAIFSIIVYYKREFYTIFVTFISFSILTQNTILVNSPESFIKLNGYGIIAAFMILLIYAVYVFERGKEEEEIEEYRPDYLVRLAERERFLRELEIARHIQSQFLPMEKPKIQGISVASMCVPAMEVGGDYYDFINIDEDRMGVIIGDVSGKGVSAAFYMTLTKGIFKTAAKSGLSPREMLINLNAVFYENAPRGVFISVIYGIFDFKRRTLTFARAGHNPLILRKSIEGKIETLNPRGIAIGLEKGELFDSVIEEKTVGITKNDVFVFYTDGITESMNKKHEEFGEDKLMNLVYENSDLNAEEILVLIKNNLEEFTDKTEQFDDQTMVIVKIER